MAPLSILTGNVGRFVNANTPNAGAVTLTLLTNAGVLPVLLSWIWTDELDPTWVGVKITEPFGAKGELALPTAATYVKVAPSPTALRLNVAFPT